MSNIEAQVETVLFETIGDTVECATAVTDVVNNQDLLRFKFRRLWNLKSLQFAGQQISFFTAMQNVAPSHLLDGELFDFKNIQIGETVIDGDTAFDLSL